MWFFVEDPMSDFVLTSKTRLAEAMDSLGGAIDHDFLRKPTRGSLVDVETRYLFHWFVSCSMEGLITDLCL